MNLRQRGESLLKILPPKAQALETTTLYKRLCEQGAKVSLRTFQRNLERLAQDYPHIHCERVGNSYRWWADKSISRWTLLPTDAMNLVMLMDHATRFGMRAQVEKLAPLYDYAQSILKNARPTADWSKKVISTTRFITLQPGRIEPEVLIELQKALLDDYSVEASYLKRGASEARTYRLKPLGLSYQDSNLYLSCVFEGYRSGDPIRALPLHRFASVKTIRQEIPGPLSFDIESLQAKRSLIDLKSEEPVFLKLRISRELHERLKENPLTTDQQLWQDETERRYWSGSLHLSQGLSLWLLSQGDGLEVLEPEDLRREMALTAARMAALYRA